MSASVSDAAVAAPPGRAASPAATASAQPTRRSPDDLRAELLARVYPAAAADWAALEAALAEEDAALDELWAAEEPPSDEELCGLVPDPDCGPPDGPDAWLADLPWELREEYEAAIAGPRVREVLKAGFWDRTSGGGPGFVAGGVADTLPPGPVLAGLAERAWKGGLGCLTDDELIGVLRAARRLASWSAALELATTNDLMARRLAEEDAGEARVAEHAVDEIAAALTLTGRAADRLMSLAIDMARLPETSRALAAGEIDLPRAAVIADETSALGPAHRAAVEERILRRAPGLTTSRLRAAARSAVIAADPAAAHRRKERAQQEARVERWTEDAGTAALAGRDLPPAGAIAADENLSELARRLKSAGVSGTMDSLRATVYLALLTGQAVSSLFPAQPGVDAATGRPGPGAGMGRPSSAMSQEPVEPAAHGSAVPGEAPYPAALRDAPYPAGLASPARISSVNLTMPLTTWLGVSGQPGQAAGYGPLDASDSRSIAAALADRVGSSWCITLTDADGRPVAHGCVRPRYPAKGGARGSPTASGDGRATQTRAGPRSGASGTAARAGPGRGGDARWAPAQPGANQPAQPGAGQPAEAGARHVAQSGAGQPAQPGAGEPAPPGLGAAWEFTIMPLADARCGHARQTPAYRPSPGLRHILEIRSATCTFPGCGRAARRCDADHTVPFHHGGRTCECNLAPLCRRHHAAKQTHGWRLEQRRPGELTWTTPSGRTYTVRSTEYEGT